MGLDRALLFRLATDARFERGVRAVPGGERAAWSAASRYVAGRTRADAVATVERLLAGGHGVSVDLFGELVADAATADRVVADYEELIGALPGDAWLSVDLTHLALDLDRAAAADRLRLGFRLAEQDAAWSMATHDGRLRELLVLALGPVPVEQLLGVRPAVLDELHARNLPTRVYVPYGADWFRYWMRRVAESRGA